MITASIDVYLEIHCYSSAVSVPDELLYNRSHGVFFQFPLGNLNSYDELLAEITKTFVEHKKFWKEFLESAERTSLVISPDLQSEEDFTIPRELLRFLAGTPIEISFEYSHNQKHLL